MGMHFLIASASVFAGWAILSLLGGERQRRLDVLQIERKAAEATAEQEKAAAHVVPIAPAARQSGR